MAIFSNTIGVNLNAGLKGSSPKGFFYGFRVGGQSHTSYIQGNGDELQKNTEERDFAFNSKYLNANAKATAGFSKSWGVSKITYSYLQQETGIIEIEEGLILQKK
jgi:hypothetical protein